MLQFPPRAIVICQLAVAGASSTLGIALYAPVQAAPAKMQAIVQHGYGGPEVLQLERIPVPQPAAGQMRIRVYAAGVNPSDVAIRTGAMGKRPGSAATGSTPPMASGSEVAGVVDALGPGVTQFRLGEAVYSFVFAASGVAGYGSYSQYTLVRAESTAPKPERFTYLQAAATPSAGLAALRTINDCHVQSGQTVVVVGAAGGVGSAIVQLAKGRGARVIAIASSQHNDYLKKLGADRIVNYDKYTGAVNDIRNADAAINTVAGQSVAALAYVKRGGTMASISGPRPTDEQCSAAGISCPREQGGRAPDATTVAEQLRELNRLIDAGGLDIHVEKTFALAQTGLAEKFLEAGHAEGKVVVALTADAAKR